MVEKYAMLIGGAGIHRMDLSSMIMIKDNHIKAQGSISRAIQRAKQVGGFSLKVEIEVSSMEDALEAIQHGADIIMLDNVGPKQLSSMAHALKQRSPSTLIEVSGGITEHNLLSYCIPGVDIISSGALTQGVPHVDYSMKLEAFGPFASSSA